MFNKLSYFIKEAISNFRHASMSIFSSITIITMVLTVFGLFMMISNNVKLITKKMENSINVSVFLKKDISKKQTESIKKYIQELNEVKKVDFISKKIGLENAKKEFGNDSEILKLFDENPMPDILNVKLQKNIKIEVFIEKLKDREEIEDISHSQNLMNKIYKISTYIKKVSLFLVIFLAIAALLIIANTIKLTVFSRKTEIEIMKLVGATNWFIRMPFIIEGIMQGVIGSVVSIGIILAFYSNFYVKINSIFSFIPVIQTMDVYIISLELLIFGIIIGFFGSLFSVGKFLKV